MNKKSPQSLDNQIKVLHQELTNEVERHRRTKIKLLMREHENHAITQSRSYRMARILAGGVHITKIGVGHIKALSPNRLLLIQRNKLYVQKMYGASTFTNAFKLAPTADLAVVIHLYYTDMLPFFVEKLSALQKTSYDLYITIPEAHAAEIQDLQTMAPRARIALVPNCGRDVLPFVQVLLQLKVKGYDKVLKMHSKKSPHRSDGNEWRDRILGNLLPENEQVLQQVLTTLSKKDTALVGPANEYVSLLVNFTATLQYLRSILGDVCGKKPLHYVLRHPDEYGFFGGTMFWARIDALLPIIEVIQPKNFEPELGQEDSTLAHALERAFNVIPELQSKKLYEVSNTSVVERDYETTNIPAWAEYSIDD